MSSYWYMTCMLLARQWCVIKKRVLSLVTDYGILRNITFIVVNGYLIPQSLFAAAAPLRSTELLLGALSLHMVLGTYVVASSFFQEHGPHGLFAYHGTATSLAAAFTSRVLFYWALTFITTLPFMPMAKLLLGEAMCTHGARWLAFAGVLFLANVMIVSCGFFLVTCARTMHDMEGYMSACLFPLLFLGGQWAPVYVIAQSALPAAWWVTHVNPLAYSSDALRVVLGGEIKFASVSMSCIVMVCVTVLVLGAAYGQLRRRMDCV